MLMFSQERESVTKTNRAQAGGTVIAKITRTYKEPLADGKLKGAALADLLRLLQMKDETKCEMPGPVIASWVKQCESTNASDK